MPTWWEAHIGAHAEWAVPLVLYVFGSIASAAVSGWRGSKLLEDLLRLGSDWSFLSFTVCTGLYVDTGSVLWTRPGATVGGAGALQYVLFPFVVYLVAYSLFDRMRNRSPVRSRRWPGWGFALEWIISHAAGFGMLLYAWKAIG